MSNSAGQNVTNQSALSVKLTKLQRQSLANVDGLSAQFKQRVASLPAGPSQLEFTRPELERLLTEVCEVLNQATSKDRQRLIAICDKVQNCLSDDDLAVEAAVVERARQKRGGGDLWFQFKVTLLHIDPPIWRRIQVPDCTLGMLHECIQASFGWAGYHLHRFRIGDELWGSQLDDDWDPPVKDEITVALSELMPRLKRRRFRFHYKYDFGDGWEHEILLEGFPKVDPKLKHAICLEGARACPPEDCGGPWRYQDSLQAMVDPDHPQHKDLVEWFGKFDPEAFDPLRATRRLRRLL